MFSSRLRSAGLGSLTDQGLAAQAPVSSAVVHTSGESTFTADKNSSPVQVHVQGAGQINVAAALAATVRVTPAVVTLCALSRFALFRMRPGLALRRSSIRCRTLTISTAGKRCLQHWTLLSICMREMQSRTQ